MTSETPEEGQIRSIHSGRSASHSNRKSHPDAKKAKKSDADLDADVLELRESGRSFAAIARQLGIPRAVDAHAAFVRAVRSQPEVNRQAYLDRETGRLDVLEKRLREESDQDPERTRRRLVTLEKLRRALV